MNDYGPFTYEEVVSRCQDAAIALRDLMVMRIRNGVDPVLAEADYNRTLIEMCNEIETDYLENLYSSR